MSGAFPWYQADPPQCWRTPPRLFEELALRYGRGGFDLDVAASDDNALCDLYYTEQDDALGEDLPWNGFDARVRGERALVPSPGRCRAFCNPPYAKILPWVHKAHRQVQAGNCGVVVMLLPGRPGTDWWTYASRNGALIVPILGRVSFVPPPGIEASSAGEGSVVVVFDRPLAAADFC